MTVSVDTDDVGVIAGKLTEAQIHARECLRTSGEPSHVTIGRKHLEALLAVTEQGGLVEAPDQAFANAVWRALKGDHNDLRKQAIILRAHRNAVRDYLLSLDEDAE